MKNGLWRLIVGGVVGAPAWVSSEIRHGFARAVFLLLVVLGCGLVDAGSAAGACWCGDGNTPTLGCCGGDLERILRRGRMVERIELSRRMPARPLAALGRVPNSLPRERDRRRLLR